MASRYWVGGTGTWDQTAHWSATSGGAGGASVPTLSDDVIFNASSFTAGGQSVTIDDYGREMKSLNFTGVTNSPTFNADGFDFAVYGSVTFISAMTVALGFGIFYIDPPASGTATLTTAGHTLDCSLFCGVYVGGDTLVLADNLSILGGLSVENITFNANGKNITAYYEVAFFNTVVNIANSTVTSEDEFSLNGSSSITATNSTIILNSTSSGLSGFYGNGGTYNIVRFDRGASVGENRITGSNTIAELYDLGTTAHTLKFSAGTTNTITNTFDVSGASGAVISLDTITGTGTFILSKASGIVSSDYLSIKNSAATGGASWYAGAHSTNVSGNTGWIFPDSPGSFFF